MANILHHSRTMRFCSPRWRPLSPPGIRIERSRDPMGLRNAQMFAAIDLGAGNGNLVLNSLFDGLIAR